MDIGTILGLLNPIKLAKHVIKCLRKPRLQIYFDPRETFHTRRLVDLDNHLGHFVHLMVKNRGLEPATGCTAQVIRVSLLMPDGQFSPHPGFLSPVVLKWAHEKDLGPRDIDHDIPRRLDLCVSLEPRPQNFSLMTDRTPSGNQIDFGPGTYRITVRVRANNASAVDATVQATYRGIWDKWEVSQV